MRGPPEDALGARAIAFRFGNVGWGEGRAHCGADGRRRRSGHGTRIIKDTRIGGMGGPVEGAVSCCDGPTMEIGLGERNAHAVDIRLVISGDSSICPPVSDEGKGHTSAIRYPFPNATGVFLQRARFRDRALLEPGLKLPLPQYHQGVYGREKRRCIAGGWLMTWIN